MGTRLKLERSVCQSVYRTRYYNKVSFLGQFKVNDLQESVLTAIKPSI